MRKRININRILIFIVILCSISINGTLLQAQQQDSINILFIGNSFTFRHNLNQLVEELVHEGKPNINIHTEILGYGGQSLFQHTEYYYSQTFIEQSTITNTEIQQRIDKMNQLLEITELPAEYIYFWEVIRETAVRDFPMDNIGYAINKHQWLLNNNPRTKWDYVVLQTWDDEYPDLNDGYAKYAKYLGNIAREQGAKVIFYMTAPDFQNYAPVTGPVRPLDYDQQIGLIMDLTQQFQPYAVIPVSMAINNIQQSGTDLTFRYVNDFHPNQRTAFLTSNMFYDALFKESTEGFVFSTVTETKTTDDPNNPGQKLDPDGGPATVVFEGDEKLYLQQMAFKAVTDFENIWKGTAVTGVSIIDYSQDTLYVGYSYQLQYNLEPAFASDKRVTWSVLSGDAVVIDTNGLLTAISEGTTTITITTNDGGFSDTCKVNIANPILASGISINNCPDRLLHTEETFQFSATFSPLNTTNQSVIWSSSDSTVATIDNNGLLNIISEGFATITVKTYDGDFSDQCYIEAEIPIVPVYNVAISNCPQTLLSVGETYQLTAYISPANATDDTLFWGSSNPLVASVDSNGLVTAKSQGSASITVTTNDGGFTKTCTIGVFSSNIPVEGVTINGCPAGNLNIGESIQLSAVISPENASDEVTWNSSDISVVSIDNSGFVTAIKAGNVTLSVTTNDGNYTDECAVTVSDSNLNRTITYESSSKIIQVYPNPFKDNLNIDFKGRCEVPALVYDSMGKMINSFISNGDVTINTSDWNKGLYFIQLDGKEVIKVNKF